MFHYIQILEWHYESLFQHHPRLTLFYEDLVAQPEAHFAAVQAFLGVGPRPLAVVTRRQHPGPLRDLIVNYDEVAAALRGTEYAAYLDDERTSE